MEGWRTRWAAALPTPRSPCALAMAWNNLYNTLFQDGMRLPQYADVDPAIVDHVDVLKGSAGSMYGRIEPGGVINVA